MSNTRNSNFELLRVIAILMITAYHYVVHGANGMEGVGNLLNIISMWGKAGVNLFCLLTGYMMSCKAEINYKRLRSVEIQVLFYTLTGLAFGCLAHQSLGIGGILVSVFPVVFGHYWFVTAYVIVFLLSPFLNRMIQGLEQKEFLRLLIICYAIWSIIPFFTLRESNGMFWNQFIWFVVMYLTGAYIRLTDNRNNKKKYINVILISTLLLVISVFTISWVSTYYSQASQFVTYFRWSNSPLIVITCIAMMRLAAMAQPRTIGWINFLASLVFGIYLFQENIFYRHTLWIEVFNNTTAITPIQQIIHVSLSVILVVLIGGIIDFIRMKIFEIIKHAK